MTPNWTPDDEERLRRALREEASRMLPAADGWDRIRERTRRVPFWKHPVLLGVAAATATAVVAIGAVYGVLRGPSEDATVGPAGDPTTTTTTPDQAAATDETPDPDQDPGPTTDAPEQPSETIPPAPEAEPTAAVTVPVYYLADTPAGPRLAREWREVDSLGTPAETAVATMLTDPLDPDYRTPWDASTQLNSVEIRDGAIKVDLDTPAGGPTLPSDEAKLAVQQLVYTVTAAYASAGEDAPAAVRILVDGAVLDEWLGIDLSWILDRDPQIDVRKLVQLNDPTEGDTMDRRPVFTGEAAVFEATFDWIIEQDGQVVERGFAMTEEGQKFSPFSFSPEVDLEPGDYVITISETDPSGGEGRPVMTDTRAFSVAD